MLLLLYFRLNIGASSQWNSAVLAQLSYSHHSGKQYPTVQPPKRQLSRWLSKLDLIKTKGSKSAKCKSTHQNQGQKIIVTEWRTDSQLHCVSGSSFFICLY